MKKLVITGLVATCIGIFAPTLKAQDTTTAGQDIKNAAKKTGKTVKKEAKKVGNKTAEIASKGKAAVVDQVYKGKQGPSGQTIYIDNDSKYYWIDKKGHKNYISAAALKDKS
jgi:hypothetical protein